MLRTPGIIMPRVIFLGLFWLLSPSLIVPCTLQAADPVDAPVPTSQAAGRMTLPEGFKATLFAGEPDVVQPIAFTFDDRGRLWVVECNSYPDWKSKLKDRVLIFEDTDGDGRFDKRKVFWDAGSNLTGIQLGFGGVWLCSVPNLIFIADENGDDAPDGEPKVLLDGWDLNSKHNVFNGLCWGPDGWLYGLNGILSNSKVGKPGTADDKRVAINTGVWRFHPTKEIFEAFAHGTTNPWGIDFDDYGQMFITNCVIKHLWHTVQGGHYERMFGQDIEPHSYQLMQSCADHIHWAGGPWQESRGNTPKHSEAGGGHAHAGCMVYLGDNWPDSFRGGVFTLNIHGARANQDVLERKGSGYVAHHGKDFFMANDPWFRGLGIQYGPDGGVFVTDWCDTGECHDYDNSDRTNGRIYKMTYGQIASKPEDLASLSDSDLVKRQQHKNRWHVGHARRILQERKQLGKLGKDTAGQLTKMLAEEKDATAKHRRTLCRSTARAASQPSGSRAGLDRAACPGRPQALLRTTSSAGQNVQARQLALGPAVPGLGLAAA